MNASDSKTNRAAFFRDTPDPMERQADAGKRCGTVTRRSFRQELSRLCANLFWYQ